MNEKLNRKNKGKKINEKVVARIEEDERINYVATHSVEKSLEKLNSRKKRIR